MLEEAEIWVVDALPKVAKPVTVNVPPVEMLVPMVVAALTIPAVMAAAMRVEIIIWGMSVFWPEIS